MLQDLAALAPPAIVCVAFLVGAWVLVRKELAPKRRARAQADRAQAATAADEREREHADHEHGAI
jgi:ABC-type nickel/cobalt efflux system permease component RcnA